MQFSLRSFFSFFFFRCFLSLPFFCHFHSKNSPLVFFNFFIHFHRLNSHLSFNLTHLRKQKTKQLLNYLYHSTYTRQTFWLFFILDYLFHFFLVRSQNGWKLYEKIYKTHLELGRWMYGLPKRNFIQFFANYFFYSFQHSQLWMGYRQIK